MSFSVRTIVLLGAFGLIIGSIIALESTKPARVSSSAQKAMPARDAGSSSSRAASMAVKEKAARYQLAPEIASPAGFINTTLMDSGQTTPITISELIGKKVILLDIWTYSCINCQRTLPYITAWHEKYRDQGLEIIGVHTPEFEFEKKYENVLAAVKKFNITYPVVQDNGYATWTAYKNRYWPRKYLIDIDGFIVYDHIGEGGYEETEKKIQELLEERMVVFNMEGAIAKDIAKPQGISDVDASKPRSPEIYFGSGRNEYLGNGKQKTSGAQTLIEPVRVKTNALYMAGTWQFEPEFAENTSAGSKIIFRYQGRDVYFVASADSDVKIKILKDGKPLGLEAGEDVDTESSTVTVREDRLYKLIEDSSYGEHTLEMIIESPGLRAFTFTFG